MSEAHGRFIWYELMTADMVAARDFYATVMGWGIEDASTRDMAYALFKAGRTSVAGLLSLSEDAKTLGAKPDWLGFVGVDDVEAIAERAKELGGAIHVAPVEIAGLGRFALLADPQGATFAVLKKNQADPGAGGAAAQVSWHELLAGDWEKAFAFYSSLFGWKKEESDTGPMGPYQVFSVGRQTLGGMFTKPPMVSVPFWLYYFSVDDVHAAAQRVKAAGGEIIEDPQQVASGLWIARCADPEGVIFALEGKRGKKSAR